jgi:predicted phosphodiesterase
MSSKRWIVLSDIHANLEALVAVLDDIRMYFGIKPDGYINLGDTVGYGPNPKECIDFARTLFDVNLCGNHDFAVAFDNTDGFNPIARGAVDYHRKALCPETGDNNDPDLEIRWTWLQELKVQFFWENADFMHGSPHQPVSEYVLYSDVNADIEKLRKNFSAMEGQVAFVGHTHFPGIIVEGSAEFIFPQNLPSEGYVVPKGKKAIICVGSVGQPRDRDPRACYMVFDGESAVYRRVPYDIETTVKKIYAIKDLNEFCAQRLREGR